MVMLNSQDKAVFRIRNSGIVYLEVFDHVEGAPSHTRGTGQERIFASGVILPIFHLGTSSESPECAGRDFVVQKLPVRTSAQVMARFHRQLRCPPLRQRAGLEIAQPLVPASRDARNLSDCSDKPPSMAPGPAPPCRT